VTEPDAPVVAAVARGAEAAAETPGRPQELDRLEVFIGCWITEGMIEGGERVAIRASDVYEWLPGRHFILHSAYGLIGPTGVGGVEIIGYDGSPGRFRTRFFDSFGNVSEHTLSVGQNGSWHWQGETTRCRATFTADGSVQTAAHERLDGDTWAPSMTVTLTKAA
jgi:hypothetical protein